MATTASRWSRAARPTGHGKDFGRINGFHGQMGMFVRALAYMLSHGADGLRQVASDAVLNANYVTASLRDVMTPSFEGPCMHEALFDDRLLKGTGVTTLDFAKAMIDEGYHPMTMYFPLVVHGAMLIEPTETESKRAGRLHRRHARPGRARRTPATSTTSWARPADAAPPPGRNWRARKPVLRWVPEVLKLKRRRGVGGPLFSPSRLAGGERVPHIISRSSAFMAAAGPRVLNVLYLNV